MSLLRQPEGYGGRDDFLTFSSVILAIDYLLALDSDTGRTLWHTRVGRNTTNGPITYMLDGRQYVPFDLRCAASSLA